MRFEKLDLNLLVLMEALYEENSLSQAGARLGLSQSATSSALGRLRAYFGDELFVFGRHRFVATALAHELRQPILQILADIRASVVRPQQADISSYAMTLRISAADDVVELILAPALKQLRLLAPRLMFRVLPLEGDLVELLERNQTDLIIAHKESLSSSLPLEDITTDRFTLIGCVQNDEIRSGTISVDAFSEAEFASIGFGRRNIAAIDGWLLDQGLPQRRIVIQLATFASIPAVLAGTSLLALVPDAYASLLERRGLARKVVLPINFPKFTLAAQWRTRSAGSVVQEELVRLMQPAATTGIRRAG